MSNIPPYQLLDPRVNRTLDQLYNAFVEILRVKHYKYIKVQDITKAAGLNRATFYKHFGKIEDFIIYCSREGFRREIINKFPIAQITFSKENFHSIVHWIFEFIAREYNLWHFQWDELMFEKASRIEFYYYLVSWVPGHRKYLNDLVFSDTTAMLVSAAIIGLGIVWCENGLQETIDTITMRSVDLLWPGLTAIIDY